MQAAKGAGLSLKQTFAKEGQTLGSKAGRYVHAKQYKRMRRTIKRQRTLVARLGREIERKASTAAQAGREALQGPLAKAAQIAAQSATLKNTSGIAKLYAWYAPEVPCIGKGKSKTPYEFGVKVGIAATIKHNLIVGARSFADTPYDGHTLNEQMEQVTNLMQDTGQRPQTVYADLSYRGVDAENPDTAIKHRGKFKTLNTKERKLLKRRQAIEPIIGHLGIRGTHNAELGSKKQGAAAIHSAWQAGVKRLHRELQQPLATGQVRCSMLPARWRH